MYSTWRSDESRGYCDLHRRCLKPTAFSVDDRRNDECECEALGERPRKDGAGERRGSPFVFGFEVDRESFEGRYGRVEAIVRKVGEDRCIARLWLEGWVLGNENEEHAYPHQDRDS